MAYSRRVKTNFVNQGKRYFRYATTLIDKQQMEMDKTGWKIKVMRVS